MKLIQGTTAKSKPSLINLGDYYNTLQKNIEARAKASKLESQRAEIAKLEEEKRKAENIKTIAKDATKGLLETGKGILQSIGKSIVKPLISTAEVPFNLATLGKKTFNPINIPGLGEVKTYQRQAQETASDIVEGKKPLSSILAPMGEAVLDITSLAIAPAKGVKVLKGGKIVQGALQGAKIGGLYGGGYGGVSTLETGRPKDILKEIGKGTITGVGAGLVLGGTTGMIGKVFERKKTIMTQPEEAVKIIGKQKPLVDYVATRPDLKIAEVKNLGKDINGDKIVSRLEWDYKNKRGALLVTPKVQDEHFAHEIGHYIEKRKPEMPQMFKDEVVALSGGRNNLNEDFAFAVKEVLINPTSREKAPKLTQAVENMGIKLDESMIPDISMATLREGNNLANISDEFIKIPKGKIIENPQSIINVTKISDEVVSKLDLGIRDVVITRQALKHIVEQRGKAAKEIIKSIPEVLNNPSKIADNSAKRENSFLFAKMNGRAKGVILEVTKKPEGNQVVSAYLIDKKTYDKIVDISGRPDVPPSTPIIGGAESEISAFQKTTNVERLSQNKNIVKRGEPIIENIQKNKFGTIPRKKIKTDGINWKSVNTSEDTENILKSIYAENQQFSKVRPSRTNQDIIEGARIVGVDVNNPQSLDNLLKNMPNANVAQKLKQSMIDSANDLMNYLKTIDTGNLNKEQLNLVKNKYLRTEAIAKAFSGLRTESSHLLRSMGIEAFEGENMTDLARQLKGILNEADGDTFKFLDKARKITTPTKIEKAQAIWYNSILSGWKTWTRNILDNIGILTTETFSKLSNPTTIKEVPFFVANHLRALPESFGKAWNVLIGKEMAQGKFSYSKSVEPYFKNKKVNLLLTEISGRALEAQDVVSSNSIKEAEKAVGAFAKQMERAGIDERTAIQLNDAILEQFAERNTFRNKPLGILGKISGGVGKITEQVKELKFLVPFTRVVSNVIDRKIDYLPLLNLSRTFGKKYLMEEANIILRKTNIPPSKFDVLRPVIIKRLRQQQLGRLYLGTMVTTGAYALAQNDKISGDGPTNLNEKKQLENTGWRPYSIKIGNTWVPYLYLGPLSGVFAAVGSVHDAVHYGKAKESVPEKVARGLIGFAQGNITMSFLSGVADLLDVLGGKVDPGKYANRLIAGFIPIPAMYVQTTQLFDRRQMDTQTLMEAIKYKLGITKDLTPRLTALGEEIRNDLIYGIAPSQEKENLAKQFQQRGFVVNVPAKTTTLEGEQMTREQLFDYTRIRGELIKVNSPAIFRLVDKEKNIETKKKIFDKQIELISDEAKEILKKKYGIRTKKKEKQKELPSIHVKK